LLAGVIAAATLTACSLPGWDTAGSRPTAEPEPDAVAGGDFELPAGGGEARGLFTMLGAVAMFRDCRSRQYLPVAEDGAYESLVRVYRDVQLTEGDPLLVRLRGRVEERAPTAEAPPRPTLIVSEFLAARPEQGCGDRAAGPADQAGA
jgi:hypothetical protein